MRLALGIVGLAMWMVAAGSAWAADDTPPGGTSGGSDANVEHFLMEGTEIQGTLEKPHVVYVVPWKDTASIAKGNIPLRRSFQQELLDPVDRARFQHRLSRTPANETGGGLK